MFLSLLVCWSVGRYFCVLDFQLSFISIFDILGVFWGNRKGYSSDDEYPKK